MTEICFSRKFRSQTVTTRIPDCDSHSSALLNFILTLVFVLQCLFPPLGNSDHVVSVSTDFLLYSQWDTLYHIAYDCSCADWDSFCDHLRDVP